MKFSFIITTVLSLIVAAGCGREQSSQSDSSGNSDIHGESVPEDFQLPEGIDASKYALDAEPEDAKDVIAARTSATDGEPIVVRGRIGGSKNPWIGGRAAFSIVDPSLDACSDIPGDKCAQPWDYCCRTDQLPTATALVMVVDENGDPLEADARALLKVAELSTVVAKGKAQVDDKGNLAVLAEGVYVKGP